MIRAAWAANREEATQQFARRDNWTVFHRTAPSFPAGPTLVVDETAISGYALTFINEVDEGAKTVAGLVGGEYRWRVTCEGLVVDSGTMRL